MKTTYIIGLFLIILCGCNSSVIDPLGERHISSKGSKIDVKYGPELGGAGVISITYKDADELRNEVIKYAKNNFWDQKQIDYSLQKIPSKGNIYLSLTGISLKTSYLNFWQFVLLDMDDKVITKHYGPNKPPKSIRGSAGWSNYHTINLTDDIPNKFKLIVTYGSFRNEYHLTLKDI
jgi:hypothetical protein